MCGLVGLSRAEAASRWARTWTSGATRFSTSCVTRCETRRRSSTPPSSRSVMASSHRVRTSPTPISSGGIPAGFVSGSSITPSARTPRSIPRCRRSSGDRRPTRGTRPPSSQRAAPCSTKPASRRGPAFAAGTAASVAAIAAEISRDLDDGDIEPWTMFIAERASMFAPAAVIGAEAATFRRDTATWWAGGFDLLLHPVASCTDARRDGPRQRRPDGRAGRPCTIRS